MWTTVAALALWVGAVDPVHAQRRGGGNYGGNSRGGGYGSGYQGGGYYGGYPGSGYNYGRPGISIGLGNAGYGYGSYPRYPSGYSQPYYSGGTYAYPQGYSGQYVPDVVTEAPGDRTTQSGYYAPASDNRARLRVRVPADATVWIDGDPTQQTGPERDFLTPPLEPGTYTYTLKGRWMQD